MQPHKVWIKQCQATKRIRRRYGAKSALDYLLGEKLLGFAEQAKQQPAFAQELPRFLAAIWQVFHPYEMVGYVACQKPRTRKVLQSPSYLPNTP